MAALCRVGTEKKKPTLGIYRHKGDASEDESLLLA